MTEQKSAINPQCLQPMLDSARNAADKGQSQYLTPLPVALHLAGALPKTRPVIVDLNCGACHLLHGAANQSTIQLLGLDIDPALRSIATGPAGVPVTRLTADLTAAYAKLREIGFRADLFTLNPPWGLQWYRDRLADLGRSLLLAVRQAYAARDPGAPKDTLDSTAATLMIALDLMTELGEGYLIGNNATLERLLFVPGAPFAMLATHIWARVVIPGNPCTARKDSKWDNAEDFHTGVIYFARSHTTGPQRYAPPDTLAVCPTVGVDDIPLPGRSNRRTQIYDHLVNRTTVTLWNAYKEHLAVGAGTACRWHLWLQNGVIRTNLTRFEQLSSKVDKAEAAMLNRLNGKTPMQLVMQRCERKELLHVAQDAGWLVQPALLAAVNEAIQAYAVERAPLYALPEIMRLGYLDEEDEVKCKRDIRVDGLPLFTAGQSYSIRTQTVAVVRETTRPNAMTGDEEEIIFTGQQLAFYIKGGGIEYCFMEGTLRPDPKNKKQKIKVAVVKESTKLPTPPGWTTSSMDFTLQELCAHFVIPEVPDVATANPEGFRQATATLEYFETLCGIKLKKFQKEDLARASLHLGLIFGWDTGLGKTWTLFIMPLLKCGFDAIVHRENPLLPTQIVPKTPVLIVAPGDLHAQICLEAREMFKIEVTPLPSQAAFTELCRGDGDSPLPRLSADGRPLVPAGFYITSYTQLTTNGVAPMPDPAKLPPLALLEWLGLKIGDPVQTSVLQKEEDVATVCDFFGRRGLKWQNEYALLSLDCRYADLDELEKRYARAVDEANAWPNPVARSNQLKLLKAAYDLLVNLVPKRCTGRNGAALYSDLAPHQQEWVMRQFLMAMMLRYSAGNGTTRLYPIGPIPDGFITDKPETDTRLKWKIKCCYSPSLSDLCYNAFDAVSIDEGVKLKGEETHVSLGCRALDPLYRCLATATPIKNRLTDVFRLAHWATGGRPEAHARFPYRDDTSEREAFARKFLVTEFNLTKAEEKGSSRKKVTAEVCNVHLLWKLFGSIILRRRKQDCGEDIVPMVRRIIRCQMGTDQQRCYAYHLGARYLDKNFRPAIGAQLQALRIAAVSPASMEHLEAQPGGAFEACPQCAFTWKLPEGDPRRTEFANGEKCPKCQGVGQLRLPPRSTTNYIPKVASVLTLIGEILGRNEQVAVFSAFNEPNDDLSAKLSEAGIRHVTLDGRTSQTRRGVSAAIFKQGRFQVPPGHDPVQPIPVMLAGVECMAEGHSFHRCNNVILYAYSWAYDKFKQALDRVHRMNSERPVNVYIVVCHGTIDARLESLIQEKGDAAELVLDGKLMGERVEEVNFAELLKVARSEFDPAHETVDESKLIREWPALRDSLAVAMREWDATLTTARIVTDLPTGKPALTVVRQVDTIVIQTSALPEECVTDSWRARADDRAARLARLLAA